VFEGKDYGNIKGCMFCGNSPPNNGLPPKLTDEQRAKDLLKAYSSARAVVLEILALGDVDIEYMEYEELWNLANKWKRETPPYLRE